MKGHKSLTPQVTIYTTPTCPYCTRAKRLLSAKGVCFDEIDVTAAPGLREQMATRAGGRRTVPQIFIGGAGLGGCDDLYALDRKGELDALLAASAVTKGSL
jgi:glutaredoxin 3